MQKVPSRSIPLVGRIIYNTFVRGSVQEVQVSAKRSLTSLSDAERTEHYVMRLHCYRVSLASLSIITY